MEKITKLALSLKFREEDLESIMEIVAATGNPVVASEILLGVYEAPEVNEVAEDTRQETNRTLISYNKFKDEVRYSYNFVRNKEAWFRKNETVFTEENIVSRKSWRRDFANDIGIEEDQIDPNYKLIQYDKEVSSDVRTSTTTLQNWHK